MQDYQLGGAVHSDANSTNHQRGSSFGLREQRKRKHPRVDAEHVDDSQSDEPWHVQEATNSNYTRYDTLTFTHSTKNSRLTFGGATRQDSVHLLP
jgi:hypothetical protein